MSAPASTFPSWLIEWMAAQRIGVWGVADLWDFSTPHDETGRGFPFAISWAIPMDPRIMVSIQNGPNQTYADEYARVNGLINELSGELAAEIRNKGYRAQPLAASVRTDTINIKGDFPQKTAATRAGIGWIGRHCQLITRNFGPWVRLGAVFTDMALPCGPTMERSFCGSCVRCIEACPARALHGAAWYPGISREEILDVHACDEWKKKHWYQFQQGHVCGICSAACPHGLKFLRRSRKDST